MNPEDFIRSAIDRLRAQLANLVPEERLPAILEQASAALRQGFAEFGLVPRAELDGHLRVIERLNDTVARLEGRLAQLEQRLERQHSDSP